MSLLRNQLVLDFLVLFVDPTQLPHACLKVQCAMRWGFLNFLGVVVV